MINFPSIQFCCVELSSQVLSISLSLSISQAQFFFLQRVVRFLHRSKLGPHAGELNLINFSFATKSNRGKNNFFEIRCARVCRMSRILSMNFAAQVNRMNVKIKNELIMNFLLWQISTHDELTGTSCTMKWELETIACVWI